MTPTDAIAQADERAQSKHRPYAVISERGVLKVWPMQLVRRVQQERACVVLEIVRP